MQYILTSSEYDALTPVKGLQERNEALEKAKQIILKESNFICIHAESFNGRNGLYGGYCDDCPISKDIDRVSSKHICISSRN